MGDPSTYPFDKYYINLTFYVPSTYIMNNRIEPSSGIGEFRIEDSRISFSPFASASKQSSWNLAYTNISLHSRDNVYPCVQYARLSPCIRSFPENETIGKLTLVNFKFNFERNDTKYIIIVPLLPIFYLLDAIFVLENDVGTLRTRLTLILAVLAFIFSLISIIDA